MTGYSSKPTDPTLWKSWAEAYRHLFHIRTYDPREETERKAVVQYCIANVHKFRAWSVKAWEDDVRLFINVTHERDHKRVRDWLGLKGSWVREWRKFRGGGVDEARDRTGAVPGPGLGPRRDEFASVMDAWCMICKQKEEAQARLKERALKFAADSLLLKKDRRKSLSTVSSGGDSDDDDDDVDEEREKEEQEEEENDKVIEASIASRDDRAEKETSIRNYNLCGINNNGYLSPRSAQSGTLQQGYESLVTTTTKTKSSSLLTTSSLTTSSSSSLSSSLTSAPSSSATTLATLSPATTRKQTTPRTPSRSARHPPSSPSTTRIQKSVNKKKKPSLPEHHALLLTKSLEKMAHSIEGGLNTLAASRSRSQRPLDVSGSELERRIGILEKKQDDNHREIIGKLDRLLAVLGGAVGGHVE